MNNSNKISFIFRAVISSILLIALIVGIFILGNTRDNKSIVAYNGESTTINSNGEFDQQLILPERATSWDFDLSIGDVEFLPTRNKPKVIIDSNHEMRVDVEFENGEYDIKIRRPGNVLKWIEDFDFVPEITIYLPEEIFELDVEISAGAVLIEEFDINTMNVDVSAGEVIVKDCEVINFESNVSAGNLKFYAPQDILTIDTEVSAGNTNIYLPKDLEQFTYDYNILAGSIENKSNYDFDNIRGNLNGGNFKRSENGIYGESNTPLEECLNLKLKVTAGSIIIDDYNV